MPRKEPNIAQMVLDSGITDADLTDIGMSPDAPATSTLPPDAPPDDSEIDVQAPAPRDQQQAPTQPSDQNQQAPPATPGAFDWNDPKAVLPITLKRGEKEYQGLTLEQVKGYAQLGLNASEKGRELNQQIEQFQAQQQAFVAQQGQVDMLKQQLAEQYQPAMLFDKAMKEHTPFNNFVQQTWDHFFNGGPPPALPEQGANGQQAQGQQQDPNLYQLRQQLLADVQQQLKPVLDYTQQQQTFQQQREAQAADQTLTRMLDDLKGKYPGANWDLPDHNTGKNLEWQILDLMGDANVTPEQAYKMIRFDAEKQAAEQAAMQKATENFQKKQALGVTLNGAPSNTGTQQQNNGLDFKHLRGRKGDFAHEFSQNAAALAMLEGAE